MADAKAAHRGVLAMFLLSGALFGAWASRVPAIKDRFGLDEAQLGLVLLCMAGGAVLSFPLAGRWIDAAGAPLVTRVTAAIYVPLLPALALAPSPELLAVALALFGASHGAMDVAMNAWGADVERARGRPIMAGLHGFFSLGAGIGAGCGALFVEAGVGPEIHFAVFAAVLGVGSFALAVAPWPVTPRPRRQGAPIFTLPRGALLGVGFVAFCASVGEGGMADWSAVYLRDILAASEEQAAIGYAIFSVVMVVTRFCGDRLIAHYGAAPTARGCGIVAVLGASCVALAPTPVVGWIGFGALGLGYALIMPLVFSRAAADPEVSPGAAVAAVSILGYGGMLLGPPLIGFVGHELGLRTSFWMIACLAAAIVVLASRLSQRRAQVVAVSTP